MIGVLDSGIGGLTIATEVRRLLPDHALAYVADTQHLPYGGRPDQEISGFCVGIGRFLVERCGADLLVVACNTATAAAAVTLRDVFSVPVVGVEPAVKPAARQTRTGRIGVLATEGTARSERLGHLIRRFADGIEVVTQPCPGLVEAIESGDRGSAELRSRVAGFVTPLVARGVDILVLGCTHYPLIRPIFEATAGPGVTVVDSGEAVARRVAALAPAEAPGPVRVFATGPAPCLAREAETIWGAPIAVRPLTWKEKELSEHETR